jgi:hypothetical protein
VLCVLTCWCLHTPRRKALPSAAAPHGPHLQGVHLCLSSKEGFGHYLNSARASGALVVVTDHPPMNEFTDGQTDGVLCPPSAIWNHPDQLFGPAFSDYLPRIGALICRGRGRAFPSTAVRFNPGMRPLQPGPACTHSPCVRAGAAARHAA